jgi:Mitochondrial ribosomal protein subunit
MATARLSPAASLLKNSRLFSLPAPLPSPASVASGTATQPHPTHAAIETLPSSRERGDWGFKRSLPLKSTTKTGTTTIRVQNGIDSIEHITDFESAADHVLTLQKWKELNLPIRFIKKTQRDEHMSVFEPKVDNISLPASSSHQRWRYQGPWLAGQTGWEFDALLRRVKDRKEEFQRYIRERLNAERNASRRQEALDGGVDLNQDGAVGISDDEFDDHMRYLRVTPSAFGPLIAQFLDLPEGPRGTALTDSSTEGFTYGRATVAAEVYKEIGPPKTHPSAGISYYRSGAHVSNHPTFGPQQLNPPVAARVLRPSVRRKAGSFGVAGFVAAGGTASSQLSPNNKPWEPTPGGAKLVVRPVVAAIDSGGRVNLKANMVSSDTQKAYGFLQESKLGDVPREIRTRMQKMPSLDEKSRREAKPFEDDMERLLRRNEDNDVI